MGRNDVRRGLHQGIVINTDPMGFTQNQRAAKAEGKIAGDARKHLELKSGKKVATRENNLPEKKENKKLK